MTIRDQLKRDEGLRLKVYADALGHPTIGYGRALDTKGISFKEAEVMLDHDIEDATQDVLSRLPYSKSLDPVRFAVLVNMAFNLGIGGLFGFKQFLGALGEGDWETAAQEMLDSRWATQVGPRAHRLAKQILTGEWQ